MSKWRPSDNCLFVIPDIHGNYDCLRSICKRILPLRKQDKLIFLGDYIDRGPQSNKVIEYIIDLKEQFGDSVITLLGNHEWLMLAGIGEIEYNWQESKVSPYAVWVENGAMQTILSYMPSNSKIDLTTIRSRIKDFIPDKHLKFLKEDLLIAYGYDKYIFVHAGCDPNQPLSYKYMETYIWDRTLYDTAKRIVGAGKEMPWEKIVVAGHNYNGPWISDKMFMLDMSGQKKLLVVELNSMEAFTASPGNVRLERINLFEKKKKTGLIKRLGQ